MVKISFPVYFSLVAEKCQAYNLLLFQIWEESFGRGQAAASEFTMGSKPDTA